MSNKQINKALNWDAKSGNAELANSILTNLGLINRIISRTIGVPTIVELLFDFDKKASEGDIYQQSNFDNDERRTYTKAITDAKVKEIQQNNEIKQLKERLEELESKIAEPKKGKFRTFFKRLFK